MIYVFIYVCIFMYERFAAINICRYIKEIYERIA